MPCIQGTIVICLVTLHYSQDMQDWFVTISSPALS